MAAAFDTARALKRTVFIQSEERIMGIGVKPAPRAWLKQFVGIEHGLWDLKALEAAYSMEFETAIVREHGSLAAHPVLGPHLNDTACHVGDLKPVETMAKIRELDAKCPVIDIGGAGGQLRFQEHHKEHGFFEFFRPAK